MKQIDHIALVVALIALIVMPGCESAPRIAGAPIEPEANIHHVVFISLHDPGDAEALLADADRLLPMIPGVVSYWAGQHHEVGRENIRQDYDVTLYVGYLTDEDYEVYVEHPNHVELVETWRDAMAELRVYDVYDDGSRRR